MTVGFLISGLLGETVLDYFIGKVEIKFVLTDKGSKNIHKICTQLNIPFYTGNPRSSKIDSFLVKLECDIIASINYLYLIDSKVINLAKGLCFNVHGSLLPKYRGRTPHVWCIINGETKTGITAHLIDQGCDTGPIIKQIEFEIHKDDTGATILNKFQKLYIPLINEIFELYKNKKIHLTQQDESQASYYGKRTPDDGRINWSWKSENIVNWVRAQSYPYPGAFTFYRDEKVIIDKISVVEYDLSNDFENGFIISLNPILVKSFDAILKIDSYRNNRLKFKLNDKFY
jgi:methionyl-tRNA formyltransferase